MKFAKTHEWALQDGDTVRVGVSQFAADQLGDVTYLELPKIGKKVVAGTEIGIIESVKSTSSLFAPVSGEITGVNQAACDDTTLVTSSPYDLGWLLEIKLGGNLDHLLTKDEYEAQIAEGH